MQDEGVSEAEAAREPSGKAPAEVTITPYRDGPYLLRGPFILRDQDGMEIPNARRVVALCRCGKSRTRPFCDGTHRLVDFHAPSGPERPVELTAAGGGPA
jgi:CDGSH-type Zn-finger protein